MDGIDGNGAVSVLSVGTIRTAWETTPTRPFLPDGNIGMGKKVKKYGQG